MSKSPSTATVDSSSHGAEVSRASAPDTVTRTTEQWAESYFPTSDKGRLHPHAWRHAAASQLHGWGAYRQRTGKSVQLTADAYEKACAAASGIDHKPHDAADYRSRS